MPGAWPAEFSDDDLLARIRRPQLVVEGERPIDRVLLGHPLPIGKDMGEDFVRGVDQLRMIDEGLPVVRGPHRNRAFSFHTLDDFGEFGCGVLMPQIGLIADHQPDDVRVAPRQIESGRNLALVPGLVLVEPDAERDGKPEFGCDLRDMLQALRRGVGAHRPCVGGNRGEVGADLRLGYPQSVGRRFGKPVVRDARQLLLDRRRGGIRILQRPVGQVKTGDKADDRGKSAQRHQPLASLRRGGPSCISARFVRDLHSGAMRSREPAKRPHFSVETGTRVPDSPLPGRVEGMGRRGRRKASVQKLVTTGKGSMKKSFNIARADGINARCDRKLLACPPTRRISSFRSSDAAQSMR